MSGVDLRAALKQCADWPALYALVRHLDARAVSAREAALIARAVAGLPDGDGVKVAYLADHTLDMLPAHVACQAAIRGMPSRHFVAPLNQHFQLLLDGNGGLSAFGPDLILLSLSVAGLAPRIVHGFGELDARQKREYMDQVLDTLREWAALACANTQATILIANFPLPPRLQAGIADAGLDPGEAEWYAKLNLSLLERFRHDPRVHVFDADRCLALAGRLRSADDRMYFLARIRWGEPALPVIAAEIVRYLAAMQGRARKCLVLDLDNTLWGGVVGEDGVDGIRIGHDFPEGLPFWEFQQAIRALKHTGVVLALASKNNPRDVDEVFEARTDMPLSRDDFAAVQVNWRPKPEQLREIARVLNIGTDSIVFMDDNPVEREQMRCLLPEVWTVEMPPDPAAYRDTLLGLGAFDRLTLTEEDRARGEQYRQNARREQEKGRHQGSMEGFLEGLETRMTVRPASGDRLARAHQLFSKTNQFNLTTRRYSVSEVEEFARSGEWDLRLVSLRDRFGDLGVIGLSLVRRVSPRHAHIDSFVVSCRALGRGVETAMMNCIKRRWLQADTVSRLTAEFLPTAKNGQTRDFYASQGFALTGEDDDGARRYELRAEDSELLPAVGIDTDCEA